MAASDHISKDQTDWIKYTAKYGSTDPGYSRALEIHTNSLRDDVPMSVAHMAQSEPLGMHLNVAKTPIVGPTRTARYKG